MPPICDWQIQTDSNHGTSGGPAGSIRGHVVLWRWIDGSDISAVRVVRRGLVPVSTRGGGCSGGSTLLLLEVSSVLDHVRSLENFIIIVGCGGAGGIQDMMSSKAWRLRLVHRYPACRLRNNEESEEKDN
ncbi:uncharacterized protein PADG_11994 [Paracoccidioides brasiliensis Pb18]|uniref:Uncharacterized protein n=1 Tax=Paracoccidioides brasiliensis (strain Pb18) TaxID=502780 RepID=A0A0A0HT75_PARBD|nr:uncharacterized protein PADG_11994 [Paracoccidioides brasiliensis Pb18]KGM91857.1 hypothetical protein PADG_11994 [Paracoccidioides brasiliensis Pb18]